MHAIHMHILHKGDPPIWPNLKSASVEHTTEDWDIVAIEHGTVEGEPSIALRIQLPSGHTAFAETTLALWISATAAMRGAFPEAFRGTALEGR